MMPANLVLSVSLVLKYPGAKRIVIPYLEILQVVVMS